MVGLRTKGGDFGETTSLPLPTSWCALFTLCCGGVVQPVFRFFPKGIDSSSSVNFLCLWNVGSSVFSYTSVFNCPSSLISRQFICCCSVTQSCPALCDPTDSARQALSCLSLSPWVCSNWCPFESVMPSKPSFLDFNNISVSDGICNPVFVLEIVMLIKCLLLFWPVSSFFHHESGGRGERAWPSLLGIIYGRKLDSSPLAPGW